MFLSPFFTHLLPKGHFFSFFTFIEAGNKKTQSVTLSLRRFRTDFSIFTSEILDRSILGIDRSQVKLTR